MLVENAMGVVKVDAVIVGEVVGFQDNDAGAKQDISRMNDLDAAGRPKRRYRVTKGEQTVSFELFYDPEDPGQAKLVRGAEGFEIEIYPNGEGTGLPQINYTGCVCDSRGRNFSELQGFAKSSVAVTVAEIVDGVQA